MIKYFQRAFKITNENIILTTPLVLFLFILSIYLGIAKNTPPTVPSFILLLVTILFMLSAFFAGWFFMARKAVTLDKLVFSEEEDKARASFNLIKELPVGIGEYFFSLMGGLILYAALFLLLSFITYKAGLYFIGKVDISISALKMALNSPEAMKSLISSLSHEQLTRLDAWNFLFIFVMTTFSFLTMFWGAQIIIKNKNPFISFFQALNFTFKNFLSSITLFIYISIINFSISFINAVAVLNPILYFLSMLVYFYFVVYIVVLIFLYYDSETQTKTQNNSYSGPDSSGEE